MLLALFEKQSCAELVLRGSWSSKPECRVRAKRGWHHSTDKNLTSPRMLSREVTLEPRLKCTSVYSRQDKAGYGRGEFKGRQMREHWGPRTWEERET